MASADILTISPSITDTLHLDNPSPTIPESSTSSKRKYSSDSPLIDMSNMAPPVKVAFNPADHLSFKPPSKVFTMKDLGLPDDTGVSAVAVSEPFQLFTPEAIQRMRAEVLSTRVWENCQYSSNLSQCQLRGFAPDYAPFVYDAWKSPETLAIISEVAGVDLVPQMDFEIGHINISMQSEEQKHESIAAFAEKKSREADEGVAGCPWEDDNPIVDWHTDSYPFVCVLMLSECTNMIGGETALRTGTGEIMKVRGPQMGCAVVLQGRYIEHQALRAFGTTERITMVTSFRPKSAAIKDDTVLTTVRGVSNLPELYFQYSEYRLEMLEERIRKKLKEMQEQKRTHRGFDICAMKKFVKEQEEFLAKMDQQMLEESKVTKGFCDDSHLLSSDLKEKSRKKARTAVASETV
ncbi:hypothetical protein EPUS_03283 [Endocarpon pusillum Z07020]|uniref:Fe2OG dioxygenase domain-containing protein n=1 Tax=Endocarpon pusillum (strain Z07020 / HMAS-L-300199) TaxID=1263415 RepID=U1HPL6_ENDPU|nr:uncharacterized protein EPUS_03283 [Endocarpon pusillum Z07020]ERF71004.1 hypothetical protein EPUS_03283 [Endocarpon pusillum Z07020]